jgi:tyrosine decarboxylase/aspartate 1-decarboxylase
MKFDFALKGVKSITVDPHKMGLAAIPAGGILFHNKKMLESLATEKPYLNDKVHYNFSGTRSGASAASAWAVFRVLGREGYRKIVESCMSNTRFIAMELQKQGYRLVCEPTLNIIGFQAADTKSLARHLLKMGWYISYIPRYDCIRIVVMPHVKPRHVEAFLADLETEKV